MKKHFKFYLSRVLFYNKKSFIIYCLISSIAAVFQTFGLISIFPLVAVFANPETFLKNEYFVNYYPFIYQNINELMFQLASIFLIFNFTAIIIFISAIVFGKYIAESTTLKIKIQIFKKIFSSNNFLNTKRSEILNFINHELQKTSESLINFIDLFQNGVTLLVFIMSIFFILPETFFFLFGISILYSTVFLLTRNKVISISKQVSSFSKKVNQISLFLNFGLKDSVVLKTGKDLINTLKKISEKILSQELKAHFLIIFPRFFFEIILYIILVIILLFFLDPNSINDNIPTISVIGILVYKSIPIFFNFYRLMNVLNKNISALYSYERISKSLSSSKKIISKSIRDFKKSIKFRNVKFSYDNNKIFNYSFAINKNDKVLISGDSGVGKSTLLNLITGMLKPTSGKIYLDDKDVTNNKFNIDIFGYVTQQPIIFPGTIYDNLKLSQKKITKAQLEKCYQICGLDKVVNNFNDIFTKQYEFDSPELSGGQKQRINIARILINNPKILILDEATSALDRSSEKALFQNLKKFINCTMIIISHRPIKKFFNKKILLKN